MIVGGAVAVGGALAIAGHSGGGGGGGGTDPDGNYGGNYNVCFEPTSLSNTLTVCDSGLVNVYVDGTQVEIVGLWGTEIVTATLGGQTFSAVQDVAATPKFPAAHLIVSGEITEESCTARVDGYSTDPVDPGNFSGTITATKR